MSYLDSFVFLLDGGMFVAEPTYQGRLEVVLLKRPHSPGTLNNINNTLQCFYQSSDYADLDAISFLCKMLGAEKVDLPVPPGDPTLPTGFRYYSRDALNALATRIEEILRRRGTPSAG